MFLKVDTCGVSSSVCNGPTQGIYTKVVSRCRLRLQKLSGKGIESLRGLNTRRSKVCHSREPCLPICHAIALRTTQALDLPPKCYKGTNAKQC